MYCNFLGLRCLPFEDRIDTRFLFLSSACNRLLASLEHDAHHERGVTPVFGDAGLGKTLLVRALIARLHASDHVAVVTCPRNGAVDLMSEVGKGFGLTTSPSEGRARYMKRMRGQLLRNAQADHRSILIVDQVEELTEENLGAVSSLVELRDSAGPLLGVILFARPHARETMNAPGFATLVQHYTHTRTIAPLNLTETQAYIEHRLAIAGSANLGMFDEGAVVLIHAAAHGNPGRINQLCHASLLATYRAEARSVSEEMASTVTTEFMQERHATSTNLSTKQLDNGIATAEHEAPEPSPVQPAAERSLRSPRFSTETRESVPPLSPADYEMPDESHGFAEPQASALATELSGVIGRGEGLMRRLELLLTRVDATGVGSFDVGLAQDAEERLVELLGRAQRTYDRADRIDSRLSRNAEELGNHAEIVQKRIGQLVDNLGVGETLQDEIRQTIQEATAKAASTNQEVETQRQVMDSAVSEARKRSGEAIDAQKRALESAVSAAHKLTSDEIESQKKALHSTISEARRLTEGAIATQKKALASAISETRERTGEEIAARKQALELAMSETRERTCKEIETQTKAIGKAISDARKRETEIAMQAWNDCQSNIRESLEQTQRVHHETAQQAQRALQVAAEELAGKSRDAQTLTASAKERLAALTQEADHQIECWRKEQAQAAANLDAQLAAVEKNKNELTRQSETEERARRDTIKTIESRLRAALNLAAQSFTKSEETAKRHDEMAQRLFVDLQEKCQRAQVDSLAVHHQALEEKLQTQSRLHDKIVASTEKKLIELDSRATTITERPAAIAERLVESSRQHAEQMQSEAKQMRRSLDEAFGECKQTQLAMVARLQQVAEEARNRNEQAVARSLEAGTRAVEDKLAELQEVLAQTTKNFDDQIERANTAKADLTDIQGRGENLLRETHTTTGQIESMVHNVGQTMVDIGSACERVGQAREQLQSAEQVTARLTAVVHSSEGIEAKLDETTGKAADLRDAFIRTSAEVETKLGQLGSHSAAATHVLSRLSESNIEAHGLIEQTAKTVIVAEKMSAGTEHAVELTERLGKVIQTANEMTGEMSSRTDEVKQSAETLDTLCTQANSLIDSIGSSVQLFDGAKQVRTDLGESIDQAQAIDAELRSAADDASLAQAQLETKHQSASELIETHEELNSQTRDLIPQLDQGIADARSTTEASQQLLDQFTRNGKTLHDVLDTLGRRANKLEVSLTEMTEKPSAIVTEARTQAAQLEQVCTAVGRVFTKLSKASLEAHEQTKEFDQASKTAFERLAQLRRVGYEIAQSLGSSQFVAPETTAHGRADSSAQNAPAGRIANCSADGSDVMETHAAQPDRPASGTNGDILKTAEAPRSIENRAANAMAQKPSREREIAGMIADAQAAEAAKS